jgi:hypothetical protein
VRPRNSCDRANVPELNLAWSYDVWAASPIFSVIISVKIVTRSVHGSEILNGRNDEKLVVRVHLRDRLTGVGTFLKPNAINRQIREVGRLNRMNRTEGAWETDH